MGAIKQININEESQILVTVAHVKWFLGILGSAFVFICSIFWFLYQDVKADNESLQDLIIELKDEELRVISDKVIFIEGQMEIMAGANPNNNYAPPPGNIQE